MNNNSNSYVEFKYKNLTKDIRICRKVSCSFQLSLYDRRSTSIYNLCFFLLHTCDVCKRNIYAIDIYIMRAVYRKIKHHSHISVILDTRELP